MGADFGRGGEGALYGAYPSTTLRVVPLPVPGRYWGVTPHLRWSPSSFDRLRMSGGEGSGLLDVFAQGAGFGFDCVEAVFDEVAD